MADSMKTNLSMESRGIMPSQNVEDGAWIDIQVDTFTNWVNEALSPLKLQIRQPAKDFMDGVNLVNLVGTVQKKPISGVVKNPVAKHQQLNNITLALEALKRDGVKLVNIGADDVNEGNKKITLGLIWAMILKYQFSDIAPKKWMLIWCNSVIPDMNITNLTKDWNNGILLSGLLNFCKPSLFPEWKSLNANNGLENCKRALQAAEANFKIPRVVSAENMTNANLDDFSMLTYLSYFTRAPDGPGYVATLRWVSSILPTRRISNFSADWKDGTNLCALVSAIGGNVRGWPQESHRMPPNDLLQAALDGGRDDLREPEILSAKDIAAGRNYLGMMAYVARLHNASQRKENIVRKRSTVQTHAAPPQVQPKRISQPPPAPPKPAKPVVANPVLTTEKKEVTLGQLVMCTLSSLPAGVQRADFKITAATTHSGGQVPLTVNWGADKAIITLTPNLPEQFMLKVHWNGKDVQGSPALIAVKQPQPPQLRLRVPQFWPVKRHCEVQLLSEDESQAAKLPSGLLVQAVWQNGAESTSLVLDAPRMKASFTPHLVGEWKVNLLFDNKLLPASGKVVMVYDQDEVTVQQKEPEAGSACVVGKLVLFEVDLGKSGFKHASGETRTDRGERPETVCEEADAYSYLFSIMPTHSGMHRLHVRLAEGAVDAPGSPFPFNVVDPADMCNFVEVGDWQNVTRNAIVEFIVRGTSESDALDVEISAPSGRNVTPSRVRFDRDGYHLVAFVPTEPGKHQIHVRVNDCLLHQMPHTLTVLRSSISAVANDPLHVGSEAIINIDTRSMRMDSRLAATVQNPSGSDVPSIMYRRMNGHTLVRFIPDVPGQHAVRLFCDGQEVGDIPFYCQVIDLSQIKVESESLHQIVVYQKAWYRFSFAGANEYLIRVLVDDPQGNLIPYEMQKTEPNSFLVEYVPVRIGEYRVQVMYNNKVLENATHFCNVYDPRKVLLLDVATSGIAGQTLSFTVDTSEAGDHEFIAPEVYHDVKAPAIADDANAAPIRKFLELQKTAISAARHRYQYLAPVGGDYTLDIKFFGERIQECPVAVKVFDGSNTQMRIICGAHVHIKQQSWTILETHRLRIDPKAITVRLTGPNNAASVPCKAATRQDGNIIVEFWPQSVGAYNLHVDVSKQPVRGSPFVVHAFDSNKVVVSKIEPTLTGNLATFEIDTEQAGEAPVTAQVFNTRNQPVHCDVTHGGPHTFLAQYTPTEPGEHTIFVGHGGFRVPKCPYKQLVRSIEMPTAHGDGLFKGEKNKECTFFVNTRNLSGKLNVLIESEDNRQVESTSDFNHASSTMTVHYTPTDVGVYKISLHWDAWTMAGSPFTAKVIDVGAVRLLSGIPEEYSEQTGTESAQWRVEVEQERQLEFDVAEAGPGRLNVSVKSNLQNVPVTVQDGTYGVQVVRFKPVHEGEYTIDARWNELPIAPFPLRFTVQNLVALREAEQNKVILSGRGLREARCNQISQFVINTNSTPQQAPRAHLVLSEQDETQVQVQVEKLEAKTYTCSYQPLVPGEYQLHVFVNDQPVRGSPFTVNVFENGDANHVVLVNEGEPRKCQLGDEYRATVDVKRAGPGELTGFARGPSGELAECSFEDIGSQRYLFLLKPRESGKHSVSIQFNGQDIPSCPFDLRVIGPPDASKVRVYGAGIQDHPLDEAHSVFYCDTRGAGSAELTITANGPTGPVPVDVQITSVKDRIARCTYVARTAGTYVIEVLWGNEPVNNSPFTVQRGAATNGVMNGKHDALSNGHDNANANADGSVQSTPKSPQPAIMNPNFLLGSKPSAFWSQNNDAEVSSRL